MYTFVILACALVAANAAPGLIGAPGLIAGPGLIGSPGLISSGLIGAPIATSSISLGPSPLALGAPWGRTLIAAPQTLTVASSPLVTKSIIAGPGLPIGIGGLGLSKSIIAGPALAAGPIW